MTHYHPQTRVDVSALSLVPGQGLLSINLDGLLARRAEAEMSFNGSTRSPRSEQASIRRSLCPWPTVRMSCVDGP